MSPIRSGLVALMSFSCLLAGTAVAQAATPAGKHHTEDRAPSPSASPSGYGSGLKPGHTCPSPDPYHKVAAVKAAAAPAKAQRYCPPGGPSASQFSLTVINNSTESHDIALYQKPVGLGVSDAMSLAWLTAPSRPGTKVTFTWQQDYSFVWSETGDLRPGVTFESQQTVAADPLDANTNHTQFDYNDGAFTFAPDSAPGAPGALTIREQAAVPPNTAAVGIGMSDNPTFAVQAQPNINLTFTPHPNYWVTAGTFTHGQVLDTDQITNEANLPFAGTFAMTATLDAAGNWNVAPRKG